MQSIRNSKVDNENNEYKYSIIEGAALQID